MSTSMDTIDSSSNIMIVENVINTSNIINQDVIEEQQILMHQPQQSHQNMKFIQQDDGNYTFEGAGDSGGSNQNAKVQIISNVTLVPKSQQPHQMHQQPQQISYVTTNKSLGNNHSYMNAVLTSKSGAATLSAGGKLINVPLKSTTKQPQQPHTLQTASIITTSPMMQKIKMPHYRIQPAASNIIIQRSSTTTATVSQQQQQRIPQQQSQQHTSHMGQLIHSKTSSAVQPQTIKTTNYYIHQQQQQPSTTPNNNNSISYNKNKPVAAATSVKFLTEQQATTVKAPVRNIGATTKQLQIQQLQTKNSYKQPNAAATTTTTASQQGNKIKYIAGTPVKNLTGQQQPQQVMYQTNKNVQHLTGGGGGKKATKMQQLQQQQQNQQVYLQHQPQQQQRTNNIIYNQGSVQKVVTKGNNKFLVQNSLGIQGGVSGGTHYVLPTSNLTATSSPNVGNLTVTSQQHTKYNTQTNTHTVVQQHSQDRLHQIQLESADSTSIDQDHQSRNANSFTSKQQYHQQQTNESASPVYATTSTVKNQPSSSPSPSYNNNSEIMIVNGAPITEEMSARILQCLSQKSMENRNQQQRLSQKNNSQQDSSSSYSGPAYGTTQHQPSPAFNKYPSGDESLRQQRIFPSHASSSSPTKGDTSGDYHKVSEQPQTITTFIDNIPLTSLRNDSRLDYESNNKWNQNDDELIGVEIRPQPVNSTDFKILSLHAVLQDHTYYTPAVTPPPPVPAPPPLAPQPALSRSSLASMNEMTVSTSSMYQTGNINNNNSGSNTNLNIMTNTMMTSPGHSNLYSYNKNPANHDDDNNSVISTGSRNDPNIMDNDLGEETETAPEGEGEDDSITRCICDLVHDDGYMICCDKCSVWQHVDCMGIDRLNIPDEYKCEVCQPRYVDKAHARSLQIIKRKQQQQHQQMLAANPLPPYLNDFDDPNLQKQLPPLNDRKLVGTAANRKPGKTGFGVPKKNKDTMALSKRKRNESLGRNNGKPRKEGKRTNKKRQPKNIENAGATAKQTSAIRSWIENYEYAMTNHYSPELRARLQAMGKQHPHNLNNSGFDKYSLGSPSSSFVNISQLLTTEQKCTTVPHAGGKILISVVELEDHMPIIEIRGKYMLSSQQQKLLGSGSKSANKLLLSGGAAGGGPFLFSYRIPNVQGLELCVDTRTYGNDARFVRRSCRPNAELLHTIEKGVVHLFLVANTTIMANTEITIKHDDIDYFGSGVIHQTCACGLVKDCIYTAQLQQLQLQQQQQQLQQQQMGMGGQMPPNAITSTPNLPKKALKRKNGNMNEEKRPYRKRSKLGMANQAPESGRTRSSSSSCESSVSGLLSPPMYFPGASLINQIITPPIIITGPPPHSSAMSVITTQSHTTPMHHHPFSPPHTPQPSIMSQLPPLPPPLMLVEQHQALQKSLAESTSIDVIDAPIIIQATNSESIDCREQEVYEQPAQIIESQFIIPPQPHSEAVLISMTPVPVEPEQQQQQQQQQQAVHVVETMVNIEDCPIVLADEKECEALLEQQAEIFVEETTTADEEEREEPQQQQHEILAEVQQQQLEIVEELPPPPPPPASPQKLHIETTNLMVVNPAEGGILSPAAEPLVSPVLFVPTTASSTIVAPEPTTSVISPATTRSSRKERAPKAVRNNLHTKIEARLQSPPTTPQQQPPQQQPQTSPTQILLSSPGGDCGSPVGCGDEKSTIKPKPTAPKQPKEAKEPKETKKLTREERKLEAYMKAFEKMERNQQRKQEQKQHKVTPTMKKRTNSSSSSSTATTPMLDGNPMSPLGAGGIDDDINKHLNEPSTTGVKRKIVNSPHKRKKRKLKASVGGVSGVSATGMNKYKGKGAKTPSKRWQGRDKTDSGSCSDNMMMSPDKTTSPSSRLLSPKSHEMGGLYSGSLSMMQQHHPLSKAADTLLSLQQQQHHTQQQSNNTYSSPISSPSRTSRSQHQRQQLILTPPPVISSTCMLIEAAVGNFEQLAANSISNTATSSGDLNEQEFKFPTRTKTKKTMMNNWLHESQDLILQQQQQQQMQLQQQQQFGVSKTSLRSHNTNSGEQDSCYISESNCIKLNTDYNYSNTDYHTHQPNTYGCGDVKREPDIFCLAAQKVEEFINQTDTVKYQSVIKNEISVEEVQPPPVKTFKVEDTAASPYPVMHVNHAGSESAVKKRWLRQAISEECTEELVASPSPPPPNGFTTPLKKRRVIRECTSNLSDLATTPTEETFSVPLPMSSPIQPAYQYASIENINCEPPKIEAETLVQSIDQPQYAEVNIEDEKHSDNNLLLQQAQNQPTAKSSKMEPEQIDALNLTYIPEEDELQTTSVPLSVEQPAGDDENTILSSSQSPKQEPDCDFEILVKVENDSEKVEEKPSMEEVKEESSSIPLMKSDTDHLDCKSGIKEEVAEAQPVKFDDEKPTKLEETLPKEEPSEDESLGKMGSTNDDMEDIQKKIASFHSENILILKSRNKKSKSLQSTPTSGTALPKRPAAGKKSSIQLNFDLNVDEHDQTVSVELKKSTTTHSKEEDESEKSVENEPYSPTSSFVATDPSSTEVSPMKPDGFGTHEKAKLVECDSRLKEEDKYRTPPFGGATSQPYFHPHSGHQSMFSESDVIHSIPPPQLVHPQLYQHPVPSQITTSHHPPSFIPQTSFTSFLPLSQSQPPTPTPGLSEYLDSTNKLLYNRSQLPPHRSDTSSHLLGPVYKTSILDANQTSYSLHHMPPQGTSAPGYTYYEQTPTTQSHVVGSTITNSAAAVSLDDLHLAGGSTGSMLQSALSRSSLAYPKIYTKTASFDPRLNPSLSTPDPVPALITPKRKLSLTEYRKRKMQSTESNTSDSSSNKETSSALDNPLTCETNVSSSTCSDMAKDKDDNGSDTSDSSSNTTPKANCDHADPIMFSPTLAELQSENLSERLKSYKTFTDDPIVTTAIVTTSSSFATIARTPSTESDTSLSSQNDLPTSVDAPPVVEVVAAAGTEKSTEK